ncbi:MAG: polyprenyl synthetase family protein [Clostridia bacterium]|nr:polyprenyl synthetase family protein [Clostridia bacterium]
MIDYGFDKETDAAMQRLLEERTAYVNEALYRYFEAKKDGFKLFEAMEYSLMAPGKRIRPVLTLALCEAFGVDRDKAMPYAAALEMVHTHSLVHEDLPCMDNDTLRRGRPTCHMQFGENLALLCGDALMAAAFEIAFEAACRDGAKGALAGKYVAELTGAAGMLGGQELDLAYERLSAEEVTEEMLLRMNALKTGALLKCCVKIADALADTDTPPARADMDSAYRYIDALGLAFQIQDDILDVTGDAYKTGKNTGSDVKDNKATFVTVLGLEKAVQRAEFYTGAAIEAAGAMGARGLFLKWLAVKLLRRDS